MKKEKEVEEEEVRESDFIPLKLFEESTRFLAKDEQSSRSADEDLSEDAQTNSSARRKQINTIPPAIFFLVIFIII